MPLPHHDKVRNLNIVDEIPLFSPAYITRQLSLSPEIETFVSESRNNATSILHGDDDRLLVVVGPCSIHDKKSAERYGELIRNARQRHNKDLEIVMRTYFEKPRTTTGWEGFTADPHLDGTYDMNHGLFQARKLLLHLAARGVPAATEFVSVTSPQYFADLITYGAIGARTVESQPHRKLTSGLSMPTGMKNATNGGIKVAIDGILSAHHPHFFDSITEHGTYALFRSKGNKGSHLILRGGDTGTNYDEKSIGEAVDLLEKAGLPGYAVIDESHGNSKKNFQNQPGVNTNICEQLGNGSKAIRGVMIESHLEEGSQKMTGEINPDISITDSCVSWKTTESMLEELADAVRTRRSKK